MMNIGQIGIYIVIIAAVCCLVAVALRQLNVTIPPFVVQCFWILFVACIVILAIKFLMSGSPLVIGYLC